MTEAWTVGLLLGATSALCWTMLDISRKHIVSKMSASFALVALMIAQIPFVLPFMTAAEFGATPEVQTPLTEVIFAEFPALSGTYLALGVASVVLNLAANWLFLRGMQISPLSLTTPYLAFTPVFSALFAFLLLGQGVTVWGIAGILVVCVGAFFLNPGTKEDGLLAPIKALWTERGSFYVLVVAVLWSITPVLDKTASDMTSPMWHTLFLAVGIGIGFTVWLVFRGGTDNMLEEFKIMPLLVLMGGLLLVSAMVLQLASYAYIEIAYVETLKRALGVIGAMVAGYFLFGEKDIARRFLGAGLMVLGVALVMFGGN
jgi:drug/metabolite transporter (DMT)-like permease